MRRFVTLLIALALLTLVVPSVAAAASCPKIVGFATLQVDTQANSGVGTALVKLGGTFEIVSFDSTATPTSTGLDATQNWYFAAGTVTFLEHASPKPVGNKFLSIKSPVEVTAGGSGSLSYNGLYDLSTNIATFSLNGRLCIGS